MITIVYALLQSTLLVTGSPAPPESTDPAAPLAIPRLDGTLRLDGRPDAGAWEHMEPLAVTMFRPQNGAAPSEPSEVRIGHDGRYLYVVARLHDAAGAGRVTSLARDDIGGSDQFRVLLDTFNDKENAVVFATNPAGVRWDAAVSGDGEYGPGGSPVNPSWNTVWDVETERTEDGWSVEIRIPFSSLRFEARDGRAVMGLIVTRTLSRNNEVATFPAISDRWQNGPVKPSLAREVVLEGVSAGRALRISPYVLAGGTAARPAAGGEPWATETTREAGVDLKLGLGEDLTLDVTVNTDFAQAEADDERVNLSRFSLFFPEKRQFFLERSGVFDFRTLGSGRLFHSRRIGLTDQGEPLRILGGARVVGKVAGWDLGALNMQTGSADGVAGENFGVLRLRRRALNDYSYFGAMLTSRIGADGRRNLALGVDGSVRLSGTDYLSGAVVATADRADGGSLADAGLLALRWERRSSRGLGARMTLGYTGPDYSPGIGFAGRRGFLLLGGSIEYGLFPSNPRVRRVFPWIGGNVYLRSDDRSIESAFLGHWWNLELRSGAFAWIGGNVGLEDVREPFDLAGGATIATGRYTLPSVAAGYQMPEIMRIRAAVSAGVERFYGGTRVFGRLGPSWNVGPHLTVGGDYELSRIRLPTADGTIRTDVARLRVSAALDQSLSGGAILQHNAATGTLGGNARLRYNFAEGRDLFVVFQWLDAGPTSADATPNRRGVVVKYTHMFGN